MRLHIRRIAGLVSLALILSLFAGFSTAAVAEDAYAMVTAKNARIYLNDDLSGKSAKVPKYAVVALLSASGGIAKIEYRGYTGYMAASALGELDTSSSIEAVFTVDGRAYALPSTSSKSVKVSAGTTVNVILTGNGCALIEKNGCFCYTRVKYLAAAKADDETDDSGDSDETGDADETGDTDDDDDDDEVEVVYDEFEAIVTDATLKVYSSLKSDTEVLGTLSEGDIVTVTAYTDTVARITYKGDVGYCLASGLSKYTATDPTGDDIFDDSTLSNEEKIFYFLVYEVDFNAAGACGALANIKRESGFRPTALNSSSGAYGICQWTNGRKANLQKYCDANGYDYTTLEGQLWYLKYELENRYPSVCKYMLAVDDSAQGAYDAGYYWCYYFEIPGNRASNSVKRGVLARDTYWPEYR